MGRKRFITSDISSDPELAEVAKTNPTAALMWPWLCTALDDWGRLTGNPTKIKLTVFQAFPMFTEEVITASLRALHDVGLLHWYQVNGHPCIAVNPASFYRINTYIQQSRQRKDGSQIAPPYGHPWASHWVESIWPTNGTSMMVTAEIEEPTTPSTTSAEKLQEAALVAEKLQEAASSVTSPSPSPSPSPSLSGYDDDNARTHTCEGERSGVSWRKWYEQVTAGAWPSAKWADHLDSLATKGMDETLIIAVLQAKKDTTQHFLSAASGELGQLFAAGVCTAEEAAEHRRRLQEHEVARIAEHQAQAAPNRRGKARDSPERPDPYAHLLNRGGGDTS